MTHYTIGYYPGEERKVKICGLQFFTTQECITFIHKSGLHPDYMFITEWNEENEYIDSNCALYYINQ